MGSHILDILRQGIWASLTGGWFYDPQQQVFCNTIHLYLWMILLTVPLAVYATTDASVLIWTIYCGLIGILFTVVKVVNYRLHHLFDTGESEEEKPSEAVNSDDSTEKQGESKVDDDGANENETIEMSNLGRSSTSAEDKTVNVSHVNLHFDSDRGDCEEPLPASHASKAAKSGNAPLAEVEGDDIALTSGSIKLSKQITASCANEEEAEEDSPDVDEDVPRTITTTADIELTPKPSQNVVDKAEVDSTYQQSEKDPLGVGVITHISDDAGSNSKSSTYSQKVKNTKQSDHETNISDEGEESNEMKNISEVSDEISEDWKPKMKMRRERRAVRRSKSTQEWNKPKSNPSREKLSSQSLNMPTNPRQRLPTLNHSTSSNSDWSDASFGEVEIPDASSCTDEQDNIYLTLNAETMMSSSVGESSGSTLVAASSSHSQFGRPDSPVFVPLAIKQAKKSSASARNCKTDSSQPPPFVQNLWSHNQEDPDTDSLTSDTSSSVDLDPNIVCLKMKDLDLTTPSSPSVEDLDLLRRQGAIPKKVKGSGNGQSGNLKESTSPGSTDLSDTEEIRRRLIKILCDPQQSEELRQLQQFVKMKKSRSNDKELKDNPVTDKSDDLKLKTVEDSPEKSSHHLSPHEEERKSTTPTEFSALLPVNPQLIRPTNRRARRRRARPQHVQAEVLNRIVGEDGHLATSHDDTTDGAVHWFQDEQGNWMSYTFGENSSGAANNVTDMNMNATISSGDSRKHFEHDSLFRSGSLPSIASNSTVVIEEQLNADISVHTDPEWELTAGMGRFQLHEDTLQSYFQALLRRNQASNSSTDSDVAHGNANKGPKSKHFYKFWLWPFKQFVKIRFDRLALLAALDRNISVIENIVSVLLAMCVGALGALMISSNFYHDLCLLLFCFIMAGCQYSLLKSVQPDAASPMHGYNRIIVFSRPFYFCVCCSVVLLLDLGTQSKHDDPIYLYGIPFTITSALTSLRDFLTIFILCFPLLFTLGLLPQVNTFLMYLLEQIDMHVFGGNATTSLLSSFYCVCRSCLSIVLLYGFAYAALKNIGNGIGKCSGDLDDAAQTVAMSILCGIIVSVSYHLSRSAADPGVLWMLIRDLVVGNKTNSKEGEDASPETNTTTELIDPLPEKLKSCLKQRLQSDVIVCFIVAILVFAVHVSTAFTSPALQRSFNESQANQSCYQHDENDFIVEGKCHLNPVLSDVLYLIAACFGFLVHYIIPQTRKEMPWLCCSHPLIRSKEWMDFEVRDAPKVMQIERVYLLFRFIERNMIYPVVCMCAATTSTPTIVCKFGSFGGPLIVLICSMKLLRSAFSDSPKQYLIIAFTYLFFKYDFQWSSETFLIDYFFVSILFSKFCDFLLKLNFIITYIAPWQITWGSAFHAVAQPLSVPHSAMLFLQASVSAIFSTPLSPFLGSAIFMTSYVRPVKFWERDYNTRRVDHTNTRLASQLERNPGADDNNLNSIFYEHLTRSLQHSLCGDLMLGRWGNYTQGDCFIMASDYLNALVHIIEVGNGLVTFQLRGLEFRGTYCQQREVEAITEGIDDNQRCCCFERGHLPHCLSLKAAFSQRWLAWEVVVAKYILEGYSITDNSAATILQVFELRKALITYYIKSIIYYTVRAPNLENWLNNATVKQTLEGMEKDSYVDLDPTFNYHIDEDYDARLKCISRSSFCQTYLRWIQCCAHRRDKSVDCSKSSRLVTLCFALSLMGRRALSAASQNSASVDIFLYGLHALFKGDFRIQSPKDEWVFADMDMIRRVVAPAVRMSLKLHQDHFQCPDEYMDPKLLYQAITEHERTMVIAHEADPAWRNAVLSNVPSLLALRHVFDEGTDEYKIIMLNKRFLNFRVVKVNRECVRGLWAGQQQELIFLRNRNPERGSIQNAKQALRNMINSSCDQPIGYPIYVSPLTASFATTHDQLSSIPGLGAEFRFDAVRSFFTSLWNRIRSHCDATCAGGSASFDHDLPYSVSHQVAAATIGSAPRQGLTGQQIDIPLQPLGNRGSLISTASSASKINTLASLANLISDSTVKDNWPHRVRILDPSQIYESINHGRRNLEVQWPNEEWRKAGGKTGWQGWTPKKGMEGTVVHRWSPGHPDPAKRSHVDKTIVLIQVKDRFVPIMETGVFDLGAEV